MPIASTAFVATQGGEGARKGSEPHVEDGKLALTRPWWESWNAAAFAAPTDELCRVVIAEAELGMRLSFQGFDLPYLHEL